MELIDQWKEIYIIKLRSTISMSDLTLAMIEKSIMRDLDTLISLDDYKVKKRNKIQNRIDLHISKYKEVGATLLRTDRYLISAGYDL